MRTRSSIPWRIKSKKRKLKLSFGRNSELVAKSSIERSLMELGRIIPGCIADSNNPETLFQGIANYIYLLETKVNALRYLSLSYGV
ncbi:hypothetical protein RchiOBHm_Chr4g0404971 [Rosa chinensis]|uniref:Uncharacterized protein n=1 Tax=Rosa chinensis TaxID=74649 RepID=A0A2P6QTZ4_ROSCH|nr:hypothetical protein RchiOBHm_Chr4g0404971 [Rosa chinensis]